jgi:voltage-gated sodium channel
MGTEISDQVLASALNRTHNFSPAEWEEFGVPDLPDDCYIKVGGKYLKPSAGLGQTAHAGLGGPRDLGTQESLLQLLRKLTASAKRQKVAALPFRERLHHNKMLVRGMYDSFYFQTLIAFLITFNFFLNAYDAHVHGSGVAPDWVAMAKLCVIWVFVFELAINMYAYWLWPFFQNGWNVFDFVIVIISVASVLFDLDTEIPVIVFRLLRACRVFSLFGKFSGMRAIIHALTKSIPGVANALLILAVFVCIYAIFGVEFYDLEAPDDFGTLGRAMLTLFRIAAGETWVEGIPLLKSTGHVDWVFAFYIMSYILVVNWVLLQVITLLEERARPLPPSLLPPSLPFLPPSLTPSLSHSLPTLPQIPLLLSPSLSIPPSLPGPSLPLAVSWSTTC